MAEERPFLEEVLDYAVYAPLGLALTALEELPALVEKGRRRLANQVAVAKFVGNLALRNARRRAAEASRVVSSAPSASVTALHREPSVSERAVPSEHLPAVIADYEALAASQIIARLASLDDDELDAVERFESTHRHRRTILNRIGQLKG